jgi:hypothetical protein
MGGAAGALTRPHKCQHHYKRGKGRISKSATHGAVSSDVFVSVVVSAYPGSRTLAPLFRATAAR